MPLVMAIIIKEFVTIAKNRMRNGHFRC